MNIEAYRYAHKQKINPKQLSSAILDMIKVIHDVKLPMDAQLIGGTTVGDWVRIPNFHNHHPIVELFATVIHMQAEMQLGSELRLTPDMHTAHPYMTDPQVAAHSEATIKEAVAFVLQKAPTLWGPTPCTMTPAEFVVLYDKFRSPLSPTLFRAKH